MLTVLDTSRRVLAVAFHADLTACVAVRLSIRLAHSMRNTDCGQGLVLYSSLGAALGVPTPVSKAVVQIASVVAQHDFAADQARTVATLGMEGMDREQMRRYILNGTL